MTEHRSPLDQALDLVLFAPVGLAVTVVEELPELAEKGRARLAQRTAAARMVGQLAVTEGRRRLGATPTQRPAPTPTERATQGPSAPPPATPPGADDGAVTVAAAPSAGAPAGAPPAGAPPAGASPAGASPGGVADLAVPAGAQEAGPGAPASGELAIPGYDSLSASQVVQRLASLSDEELEAVRQYEAANRARRTILARVAQLQRG